MLNYPTLMVSVMTASGFRSLLSIVHVTADRRSRMDFEVSRAILSTQIHSNRTAKRI